MYNFKDFDQKKYKKEKKRVKLRQLREEEEEEEDREREKATTIRSECTSLCWMLLFAWNIREEGAMGDVMWRAPQIDH